MPPGGENSTCRTVLKEILNSSLPPCRNTSSLFLPSIFDHQPSLALGACFSKDCHHRAPVRKA
jgi:hypothetical protein